MARHALDRFSQIPDATMERARLITAELVANGIKHTESPESEPIRFRARQFASHLRIEVQNQANSTRPTVQPRGELRTGGYGPILVDELADRWGTEVKDGVILVWSEVDFTMLRDPTP